MAWHLAFLPLGTKLMKVNLDGMYLASLVLDSIVLLDPVADFILQFVSDRKSHGDMLVSLLGKMGQLMEWTKLFPLCSAELHIRMSLCEFPVCCTNHLGLLCMGERITLRLLSCTAYAMIKMGIARCSGMCGGIPGDLMVSDCVWAELASKKECLPLGLCCFFDFGYSNGIHI